MESVPPIGETGVNLSILRGGATTKEILEEGHGQIAPPPGSASGEKIDVRDCLHVRNCL